MTNSAEVPICTLLLFVATPAEETALTEAAGKLQLGYRKDDALTKHLRGSGLMEDAWIIRDELYATAPRGNDPIVGGEMEGVGLLAASIKAEDPVWCVVKGIGDFADERRNEDIQEGIKIAPQNAAYFFLSALKNDADMLAK